MSKERLEELAYNVAATTDGKAIMSGVDYSFLYEYALEQAERVQELETYVETGAYIQRKLRKENKRYREGITEAMKLNIDGNYNYDVDKLLQQILEESK